jgi:hypothetical protein
LENVAGIVDPGHNLYSRSDRSAWGVVGLKRIGFLFETASLKSCCPKNLTSGKRLQKLLLQPRRTKTWRVLAVVSALPSRNTFVRLPKRRRRTDVESKNPQPKGKNP